MIKNKVNPAAAEGEGSCGGRWGRNRDGGGMAAGEDEALFARLRGRGECGAADGSACWHFATGASTFLVGLHLVWGQRHKGELSCVLSILPPHSLLWSQSVDELMQQWKSHLATGITH